MALTVHAPSELAALNETYIQNYQLTEDEIESDKLALVQNKEYVAEKWKARVDHMFGKPSENIEEMHEDIGSGMDASFPIGNM